jgi:hypothetical protein
MKIRQEMASYLCSDWESKSCPDIIRPLNRGWDSDIVKGRNESVLHRGHDILIDTLPDDRLKNANHRSCKLMIEWCETKIPSDQEQCMRV